MPKAHRYLHTRVYPAAFSKARSIELALDKCGSRSGRIPEECGALALISGIIPFEHRRVSVRGGEASLGFGADRPGEEGQALLVTDARRDG